MTIAVPQGMPVFDPGAPTSKTFEGFTVEVRGSTDLGVFTTGVTPVTPPVIDGLPNAGGLPSGVGAFTKGGITYDYRSFRLDGNPEKGFLQARVFIP